MNGKDIKKVMNIACHILDRFLTIFKGGKMLSDTNIDALCLQFQEVVFVLWDGAFVLVMTIDPTEIDTSAVRTCNAPSHP